MSLAYSGIADIWTVFQELVGSTLPAMEGDELDVTLPKSSKETGVMDAAQPSTDSNGLSVLQNCLCLLSSSQWLQYISGLATTGSRARKVLSKPHVPNQSSSYQMNVFASTPER